MVNDNSSYVIVEKNIKLNRNFCFFLTGNNPDTIEDYISLRLVFFFLLGRRKLKIGGAVRYEIYCLPIIIYINSVLLSEYLTFPRAHISFGNFELDSKTEWSLGYFWINSPRIGTPCSSSVSS